MTCQPGFTPKNARNVAGWRDGVLAPILRGTLAAADRRSYRVRGRFACSVRGRAQEQAAGTDQKFA